MFQPCLQRLFGLLIILQFDQEKLVKQIPISMEEEEDLKLIMAYAIEHDDSFRVFPQLKFKNTLYEANDDIMLIQKLDEEKSEPVYGKILTFAQIKRVEYPVLLIAWYYSKKDQIASDLALGQHELVISDYLDWQYVETVMGKIKVFSEQEFADLDPLEKEKQHIFYRKKCLWKEQPSITSNEQTTCTCEHPSNPEQPSPLCQQCQIHHHAHCSGMEFICPVCNK